MPRKDRRPVSKRSNRLSAMRKSLSVMYTAGFLRKFIDEKNTPAPAMINSSLIIAGLNFSNLLRSFPMALG